MSVAIFTAVCVLLSAGIALTRRHYLFAVAVIILGAYELLGPILYSMAEDPEGLPLLALFAENASAQDIAEFTYVLSLFLALFVISYLVAGRRHVKREIHAADPRKKASESLWVFPIVILAFGIVSVMTGAGEARLEDYVGIGDFGESSRFFAYGGVLLVVGVGVLLSQASAGRYAAAAVVLVCLAPLAIELFVAGRRQWFAPSALLVLMFLLYSPLRFKAFLATGFTVLVAILFALQFALREEIQQVAPGIETESLAFAVFAPQVGEFVGIGAISLAAWNTFVFGDAPLTGGTHWGFHALNTVPFLKLGDFLFPQFATELSLTYRQLAPWGGLSMVADTIMAFGLAGVPLLAIALGIFCRAAHAYLAAALRTGMPASVGALYWLSLISTLLLKYRGGISDALQSFVALSILFWFFAYLGYLILDRRAGAISVIRDQNRASSNPPSSAT